MHLDQIMFIPTGDPPHKESTSLVPAPHRLTMVELALDNHPKFVTSNIEVRSPATSYSIHTIRSLNKEHGSKTEWSFILGLDAFLDLPNWKRATELLTLCHFIVCSRPGNDFRDVISMDGLPNLSPGDLEKLDTGQSTRLDILLPTGNRVTFLSLPPCEVSASFIRKELSEGRSVSRWLPGSVESYIMKHGLYLCPLP